jgi:hypothetical protein
MYMPVAMIAVTKTAVNSRVSARFAGSGWIPKKMTEATMLTTTTGTISRHLRRVATDTAATTTAPEAAVARPPTPPTRRATTSGWLRRQRSSTMLTTPIRRSTARNGRKFQSPLL